MYLYVVCLSCYNNQPWNEALYCYVFQIYGVSTAEAMELLEHFLAMNPDNDGRVKAEDFWAHFGLDCSPLCKKVLTQYLQMLLV